MDVTAEMLDAAILKAVETGLLSRRAMRERDSHPDCALVKMVIQAALDRLPEHLPGGRCQRCAGGSAAV